MKPARLTAAALLCISIGLLTLTLTTGRAEGASDPDDDTWATADGIGLAGSSRGDLVEPAAPADAIFLPSPGVSAPAVDATGAGDVAGPADVYDVESPSPSTTREDSSGERGRLPTSNTDDYEIADSSGDYATDDTDFDYDGGDSDSGSGDTDYDYDDGEISYGGDDANDGDYDYEDGSYGYDDSENTYNDDYDLDFGFKRRGRYVYVYLDDEDETDAGRYGKDDVDYDYDYDYDYDSDYRDFDYGYDDVDYGYGDDLGDDDFDMSTRDGGSDFEDDDFDIDNGDDDFGRRRKNRRRDRGSRERGRRGRGTQRRGGRDGGDRVRTLSAGRARPMLEEGTVEFDDASARPEEIPSGYFGPEPEEPVATPNRDGSRGGSGGDGGSGGSVFASGSIDFPGFRLVISEASEWWKFDKNVCLNKEFLPPTESEDEGLEADISIFTVRCSDISTTEHSCNITQWNGTVTTAYRLTYACCRGYTRLRYDKGCPRKKMESPLGRKSLGDLLRSQDYSQKVIDLFNTVLTNDTKKQWTVFVPSKEALDAALRKVDFRESGEGPVPEWFVRTMLNHFVQPALTTQAMRNGQQLPTLAKTGGGLLITKTRRGEVLANCQPIVKANQPFNQYSLVHFTSAVLVIQQSSLYQLMLRRLTGVVPAGMAVRLLAPVKSVLTGARPVTVFMHLPSKDEIANNCYARNLRSAMVFGAECNASLSGPLRSIDGKFLRLTGGPRRLLIDGNRVLLSTDHMASNGVLHLVNATESLIGYANEVTRRLTASDVFKPLLIRPGRVEGSLAMLIPPNNGSYTYANTSTRWDNATKLVAFGRRHLVDNATAMMGRTVKLAMLDGVWRDFVLLRGRQESASIFGPDRFVRYRFVDCVRVVGMAKDCSGTVYQFLKNELPDFNSSITAMEYLSRDMTKYTWVRRILAFALESNNTASELSSRLRRSDTALVLLKDEDMQRLSGGLISRRRTPTDEQMDKLAAWFGKYLVASKQICPAKSISPTLTVPVFNVDRRPCRSMICAFRRRVHTADVKRVQLRMDSRVVVKEGFLLPGQLTP